MVLGLEELKFGPGCAGTLTVGGGAEEDGEDADDPAAWPPVWACAAVRHRLPIAVGRSGPELFSWRWCCGRHKHKIYGLLSCAFSVRRTTGRAHRSSRIGVAGNAVTFFVTSS
jgi:hypothetical protein